MQLFAKDLLTLDDEPNESQAARPLLAAECLRASGRLRLRVRGESMLPSLWPGDEVEIASCAIDDVRKGEVVLALRDGRFFLHRFVGRLPGGFLLRGDSMPTADPEFGGEALLGRVSSALALRWWSRVLGRLFSRCGPALRLALKIHAVTQRRREVPLDATAVANSGADLAAARGQECPPHTIVPGYLTSAEQPIPEMPHGGV